MEWSGGWYLICFIIGAVMLLSCVAVYVIQRKRWFHWEEGSVERVATSTVLPPFYFFLVRCVLFGYVLGCLVVENSIYGRQYQFYTIWNYTLLCFYFFGTSVVTGLYTFWPHVCSKTTRVVVDEAGVPTTMTVMPWRWLVYGARCCWMMQHMIMILVFLVDIVYWSAVFTIGMVQTPFGWYVTLSNHLFNLVFIYADFLLNQTRFRYAHIIFAILFSEVFVVFQWIYFPVTNIWVYSILNVLSPYAILWYIGLFLSLFVFTGIAYCIDAIKQRCLWHDETTDGKMASMFDEEQHPRAVAGEAPAVADEPLKGSAIHAGKPLRRGVDSQEHPL